jgi:hypothetical protein
MACQRLPIFLRRSIKTMCIWWCGNLRSLSGQLDALQTLSIKDCSKLKSLESCLGRLPSLEDLDLRRCSSLRSLPNGPQAYSALRDLRIKSCSGIKLLPSSLQQRLDHLEKKKLYARYEGNHHFFCFISFNKVTWNSVGVTERATLDLSMLLITTRCGTMIYILNC